MIRIFLASLLPCAGIAWAQGSFSGPGLGFTLDPQVHALRPIQGIPGSSMAGEPLDPGFGIALSSFSAARNYALAVTLAGAVNLIRFGPDASSAELTSFPSRPDRIVLSPSGTAAAVLYSRSVQIATGLPDAVQLLPPVDLSAFSSAPGSIAISDDGELVLISIPGEQGVFAFAVHAGGAAQRLPVSSASALAFFAGSHDAALGDASGAVTVLRDIGGGASMQFVASDDRLSEPAAIQTSRDRSKILVASSAGNGVAILDMSGANHIFLPCTCSPARLDALSDSVYQLTTPHSGLFWILDISQPEPRLLFVPLSEQRHSPGPESQSGRRIRKP